MQHVKYLVDCKKEIVQELIIQYSRKDAEKMAYSICRRFIENFYAELNDQTEALITNCDHTFAVSDSEILVEDLVHHRKQFETLQERQFKNKQNLVQYFENVIIQDLLV